MLLLAVLKADGFRPRNVAGSVERVIVQRIEETARFFLRRFGRGRNRFRLRGVRCGRGRATGPGLRGIRQRIRRPPWSP